VRTPVWVGPRPPIVGELSGPTDMKAMKAKPARWGIALGVALVLGGLAGVRAVPQRREIPPAGAWVSHLHALDQALTARDPNAAARAWLDAYRAARVAGNWRALVAVGDASLRLGEAQGSRRMARAQTRQAYLLALTQADRQRSLDGVLVATEAFAALGDQAMVEGALRIAERLAARTGDGHVLEHVWMLTARHSRLPGGALAGGAASAAE
jgi:hypothetical protein